MPGTTSGASRLNRREALWASIDAYDEKVFRAKIENLVGQLPVHSPVAPLNAGARSTRPDIPTERSPSTGERSNSASNANVGDAP